MKLKILPSLNSNVCENMTKTLKMCFHFSPEIPNAVVYPKGLLPKILSFVVLFLKVMKLDSVTIDQSKN